MLQFISKHKVLILSILLLNIFLKFYGIDKNSIWIDEVYSINEAQSSVQNIIAHSSQSDNPPVYYLLLHFWVKAFGFSEFSVRSLSAVCSILAALILFYFISRNFNLNVGIISSLFFTFSNENLFYAQETRTYALVILLTVISLGLFFEIFNRNSKVAIIFFTICNSFLIYSHYLSIFIPVIEFGIAILYYNKNKRAARGILISIFLSILCFLPWSKYPLSHAPKEGLFWLSKPTFSNFKGLLISIAGNKVTLILCFLVLFYMIYKNIQSLKKRIKVFSFEEVTLLVLTFFPIISVYFIAGYIPIFLLRYLLFVSIPFYILIPFLLDKYIMNSKLYFFLAGLLILSTLFTLKLHPTKDENWRDAISKIKDIRKDNEVVFITASYTSCVFSYYFDKNIFFLNESRDKELVRNNIFPVKTLEKKVLDTIPNYSKVIAIFCHETIEDPNNNVQNTLNENFKILNTYKFEKVRVVQYENLPDKKFE